ncbi:MAG: hypothetical protein IID55_12440 [Proteobacteria bacterium]|nr:hypothetical protein [Pseudomonadota bacterium]
MLTKILAAGTMVSAALAMSVLPSQAGESLPAGNLALGGLAPVQLQNVGAGGAGGSLDGDFFLRLTQVNTTTLSAVNAGVFVRNRVFGAGAGTIGTGPIQDIHLENVQGITNIIVNTGINSNIQQSVSVNYVIRPPAE